MHSGFQKRASAAIGTGADSSESVGRENHRDVPGTEEKPHPRMDVSRQRSCGSLIVFSAESACWRTPLRLRTGWIKRVLQEIAEEGAFEPVTTIDHFPEQGRGPGF